MRNKSLAIGVFAAVLLTLLVVVPRGSSQSSAPRMISQAVDESKMVTLRGNVHPLARPEFDKGPAPASMQLDRMLLVLKRSATQEAALATFLAQQNDPSSPVASTACAARVRFARAACLKGVRLKRTKLKRERSARGACRWRSILHRRGRVSRTSAPPHGALESRSPLINGATRHVGDPESPLCH